MMAKGKIHPLWYSEFIPVLFFVSSIFAGLSMVIFEGSISHKVFRHRLSPRLVATHDSILTGLSRICAGVMFVYLALQALVFVHERRWNYLDDGWGAWYLLELIGFVAVPLVLFARAALKGDTRSAKVGSALALLGIVLNRLNISVIAFKWYEPVRYVPSWMEIVITMTVVFAEIWAFRWIVNRMPVLGESPAWATHSEEGMQETPRRLRLVKEA
jgi:Ni/Fe-hydrogenase subunit HybB-like protein